MVGRRVGDRLQALRAMRGKVMNRCVMTAAAMVFAAFSSFAVSEAEAIAKKGPCREFAEKAERGEFKRARASWWGFDPADSTRFLQSAVDARVPELVVDAMPSPWVVAPIRISGANRKIIFEEGAKVAAKPGEFRGRRDSLFDLRGSTNLVLSGSGATLRMRRADYIKPPYERSEWRYGISAIGCKGVVIEGLTVEDTGGDGICIGSAADIVVRDCKLLRNHRQGISICDGENVLVERCLMADTAGTAPSAGIDFEPDSAGERLKNIVVRNSIVRGNAGAGFQVCLNQLNSKSEPVSILIEDCLSEGNQSGTSLIVCRKDDFPRGEVRYRNVIFRNEKGEGVGFEKKPAGAVMTVFENCRIERANALGKDGKAAVLFYPPKWDDGLPGDVVFDGLTVVQRGREPWLGATRRVFGERARNFRAKVSVVAPDGRTETRTFDDAAVNALFPEPEGERAYPRYEIDFRETEVFDMDLEHTAKLSEIAVSGNSRYVFYVNRARRVRFTGRQVPHRQGGDVVKGMNVLINGMHSRFFTMVPQPLEEAGEICFDVPAAGWYTMRSFSSVPFTLLEANVPVALDLSGGAVTARLVDRTRPVKLWFDIPDRRYPFSFVFSGTLPGNRVSVRLKDFAGEELFRRDNILDWTVCTAPKGGASGPAELDIAPPSSAAFYYFRIDATGLPAYLFLSREKRWHWNGRHRDASKRIPPPNAERVRRDPAGEAAAMKRRGPNREFVAKVESGAFRTARASWWGFDKVDSTRFLQAAIDSGVERLVVDAMPSEWMSTPLFIRRGNLTVEFERGAVLMAKKGAFIPLSDCLMTVDGAENVTLSGEGKLKMYREDYTRPPYVKGEWRACLYLRRSRGVTVDGLKFERSGGDGITVGRGCRDITIRNCVSDSNFRQGISVLDAENLLIENCVLANTAGTAPASGIDFEPDSDVERLVNCVMRGCIVTNNAGTGIDVCLNNLRSRSAPVSLTIENCRFEGNGAGTAIRVSEHENPVGGMVLFRRCSFSRCRREGIGFERKSVKAPRVVFERCVLSGCGTKGGKAEILFFPTKWSEPIADGIEFDRLSIFQTCDRPWIAVSDVNFAPRPRAISGIVKIKNLKGEIKTETLDLDALRRIFPEDGEAPYARSDMDYREVKIIDRAPGRPAQLSEMTFQSFVCFRFYVAKAGKVVFKARMVPPRDGMRVVSSGVAHVNGIYHGFYVPVPMPGSEVTEMSFDVDRAGWYHMRVTPGFPNCFRLMESSCPVGVVLTDGCVMGRVPKGDGAVWFDSPTGRTPFSFIIAGTSGGNSVKLDVFSPDGERLGGVADAGEKWQAVMFPGGTGEGLSKAVFSRSPGRAFWYFKFDLTGLPGVLFLSPDKCWHWNGRRR